MAQNVKTRFYLYWKMHVESHTNEVKSWLLVLKLRTAWQFVEKSGKEKCAEEKEIIDQVDYVAKENEYRDFCIHFPHGRIEVYFPLL